MSNETLPQTNFESRCHRVLQFARDLYRQSPDWVRFFREVVGVDGAARKLFPTQQEYVAFERSEAFHTIQRMVNALRNNKSTSHCDHEETRVITVRLPESLHEALKAEANDHSTSMNKLCIAKLLQVLDEDEATQRARAAQRTQTRVDTNGTNHRPHVTPATPAVPSYATASANSTTPPYRPNVDRL
jgi:predicted HicB family RNase H-like nuclease